MLRKAIFDLITEGVNDSNKNMLRGYFEQYFSYEAKQPAVVEISAMGGDCSGRVRSAESESLPIGDSSATIAPVAGDSVPPLTLTPDAGMVELLHRAATTIYTNYHDGTHSGCDGCKTYNDIEAVLQALQHDRG